MTDQIRKFEGTTKDGQYDVRAEVKLVDLGQGPYLSVVGEVYVAGKRKTERNMVSCGQVTDEIADALPELDQARKFHLVSTDRGPMHYIANTVYHAEEGNLEAARSTAIWTDATLEQLQDKDALMARLPEIMSEFYDVLDSFDFDY